MKFKSYYLSVLACLMASGTVMAQSSIVVDSVIQTSLCAGGTVVIPYSVIGQDYNFGNIFTAQLSEDQDFFCQFQTFGNPLDIGIMPYWSSGYVLAQIPDSMTLGTYRIRIISSDPPDTSNISPNCILITNLPQIIFTISGNPSDDTLCKGDSVQLSVFPLPASYKWSTGETTSSIWVKNSGSYTVTARDTVGCETESDPYTVVFETCLGLEEPGHVVSGLSVQPVPSAGKVELTFNTAHPGEIEINVYSMLGKEVLSEILDPVPGINHRELDLSSLPAGVYILKLTRGALQETRKLVRQ